MGSTGGRTLAYLSATPDAKQSRLDPLPEGGAWAADRTDGVRAMSKELVDGQMYPLTIRGLEEGMKYLSK